MTWRIFEIASHCMFSHPITMDTIMIMKMMLVDDNDDSVGESVMMMSI
jgi:hypothetical protein